MRKERYKEKRESRIEGERGREEEREEGKHTRGKERKKETAVLSCSVVPLPSRSYVLS